MSWVNWASALYICMIFYSPLLTDLIRVRIKRQYLWSCQPWLKCFFYNQSYTGSEGCLSINEGVFSISISNPALLATWLTLQRRRHYSLHNILCGSLTRAVYWKNVEQHIRVFCDDNDTLFEEQSVCTTSTFSLLSSFIQTAETCGFLCLWWYGCRSLRCY